MIYEIKLVIGALRCNTCERMFLVKIEVVGPYVQIKCPVCGSEDVDISFLVC